MTTYKEHSTTYDYLILEDDASTPTRRTFSVVNSEYSPESNRDMSVSRSISGKPDIALGGFYEQHKYVFLVPNPSSGSLPASGSPLTAMGTLQDLEYFYRLNDPTPTGGSASCRLKFRDHYGDWHYAYMQGTLGKRPLNLRLHGDESYHFCPVILLVTEDITYA